MDKKKLGLLLAIAALVIAYITFDLGRFFNLETLKAQQSALQDYYAQHPSQVSMYYFLGYIAITALSLPGAAIMTLAGGALFGFSWGLFLVSFASSIGATLAFLIARYILRDSVQQRFGHQLRAINEGFEKEGWLYLLTLRLVPAFPFFLVNIISALTPIKTLTFYVVSQLGMLAGTAVFVNAGTQLAQVNAVSDVLSPALLGSFVLLGIFPLIAKKAIDWLKAKKVYANHQAPKSFDRNLIVIGAGSGGLVASLIAAAVKAKVTLVEKHEMGGDCLNTGCVPSKALIRSAKFNSHIQRAKEFGFSEAQAKFEFSDIMKRVHEVIARIAPHDSVERFTGLGVECIAGEARIEDPWTVSVNGQKLTARNIVIATGARPFVPPIKGIEQVEYLTSDNLWQMTEQPKRLVVLGGGPIGSELTQCFARLGSDVTQVEMLPRIMVREDEEVSQLVTARFEAEGVKVLTNTRALEVKIDGGEARLLCEREGEQIEIPFDKLLVAVGRAANISGFGLEELGVTLSPRKTIEVDPFLRTNFPNIFAVGDVAGPYQFTHTASHQAWYAAVNALFGQVKKFRADYRVIPWATFVEPEVARVGLNEQEAKDKKIPYDVTRYDIDDLDRAIADGEAHGFVKVLTVPGKDKILGVTIVGEHAGDLIAEYVMAMKHGLGLNKILGTIHIYPTLAEANKFAAGVWKRENAPQGVLKWVEKYHTWRRG